MPQILASSIANVPNNIVLFDTVPSTWSNVAVYKPIYLATGGAYAQHYFQIPIVSYGTFLYILKDWLVVPSVGITPNIDTAGWQVYASETAGGSGGTSTPSSTALSVTAEAQSNTFTPLASTTHNILAIDYNNLYLRNTVTIQTASYSGVVEISNISNSNRAISTKIIFPDASSKIVSLNKNSTIVYNVINDVYTSYNVVTRVVQSMAVENIPLLATTPIAGLARTLNMVYELSNQTNAVENGTYECTNATTGQLAVIELASNRPQLARLNVIDGEVATRGGIFEWWVEDDAFTTVWRRLDSTGASPQYKTLAIATLVYSVPQEIVVAWDTPFASATQSITYSYTNDQNIAISVVEKQGTLTNAGATFIVSSNNNSMDITGISIKFAGLGN
jgi:hypothetical protein